MPVSSELLRTVLFKAKAARVLAALKRDGQAKTRRSGSHRVLLKGDQQRICAYHNGADLGGRRWPESLVTTAIPLAELQKL